MRILLHSLKIMGKCKPPAAAVAAAKVLHQVKINSNILCHLYFYANLSGTFFWIDIVEFYLKIYIELDFEDIENFKTRAILLYSFKTWEFCCIV